MGNGIDDINIGDNGDIEIKPTKEESGEGGTGTGSAENSSTENDSSRKKRGRPSKTTRIESSAAREKPTNKSNRVSVLKKDRDNATDLITGGLQSITSIPSVLNDKLEYLTLTDDEAREIAEPLVNVMIKRDMGKFLVEQTDEVKLAIAIGKAVFPRAIASYALLKERNDTENVEHTGSKDDSETKDIGTIKL